jgi:hypothetical protein
MTPKRISTAYFINPSQKSVCLYVYIHPIVARQQLSIPLSLLGNGSIKAFPRQKYMQQQKNC